MKPSSFCRLAAILLSWFTLSVNLQAQDVTGDTDDTGAPAQQPRPHFLRELNLTDAQKAQIKQIHQSTPKGKARRQAVMAILTPEQKAQLIQDFQKWKAQRQTQ